VLLERSLERGLGFIPDLLSDLSDAGRANLEKTCRNLDSPTREVMHWRFASVLSKVSRQLASRHATVTRQVAEGPVSGRVRMNQSQCVTDLLVP
jgi:hypothetical protein